MGIIGAIRALRGYLRFSVEGDRPERFLNLCAMSGVPLWEGRRRGNRYTACTTAKSADALPALAGKAGLQLTVEKERGVPALSRRYKKRLGLLAGGVLLAVALIAMGSFIWTVQISGLETIPEQEVWQALDEMGIRRGVLRRSIDVRACERELLLRFDRLCWAGVNLRGSTAAIELAERTMPPEMIGQGIPYNVIATKSGFITAMEVYNGQPVCKVGDSVAAGEVIVSGIMESGWGGSRYVHARAKVTAQTADTVEIFVAYTQEKLVPSGSTQRRYLEIFGLRIPLTWKKAPPEPNLRQESESEIPLLTSLTSAKCLTVDYTLLKTETQTLSQPEAQALAEEWLAEEEALRFAGATVLSRDYTGQETEDGFLLFGDYICEEIISEEVEIETE